jgi:hypothetical protein
VGLIALWAPVPARGALSVRTGTVEINSTKRSTFRFDGRSTLSLDGAAFLGLQIDHFAFVLPMSGLAKRGSTYTYRGKKGVPGLHRLRLDTRSGRFMASGRDLALAGIANPTSFRLVTDTADECAMVRFARKESRRAKSPVRLRLGGMAGGCDIPERPSLDPSNVPVGQSTDVRVQVVIPSQVAVETDTRGTQGQADGPSRLHAPRRRRRGSRGRGRRRRRLLLHHEHPGVDADQHRLRGRGRPRR